MNKTGTQTIETHRLILRQFRLEDAEDMFAAWASDPDVTRFLTWPAHTSEDITRMVLTDWISRYGDGSFFNSFLYDALQYITCILTCLGYYVSCILTVVGTTIQYGHASDKIDGVGVAKNIERFDEFDNF